MRIANPIRVAVKNGGVAEAARHHGKVTVSVCWLWPVIPERHHQWAPGKGTPVLRAILVDGIRINSPVTVTMCTP
jgi:hypothetical protein